MALYPVVITLYDIPDVEDLCTKAAKRWCRQKAIKLTDSDLESLVSYLVVSVWRLSERYDSARSSSFEAIVRGRLSNRCVDWIRQQRGRTRWQFSDRQYERDIPRPISLDSDPMAESLGAVDRNLAASVDTDP